MEYYSQEKKNSNFHYCAFHKHANSEVQKRLHFWLPSIILTDLLGNRTLL